MTTTSTSTSLQEQANTLAHRGLNAVHDGAQQLRTQAEHAGDLTVRYIKAEPIKAVLIAAATGAALMALAGLIGRARGL